MCCLVQGARASGSAKILEACLGKEFAVLDVRGFAGLDLNVGLDDSLAEIGVLESPGIVAVKKCNNPECHRSYEHTFERA